MQEYIQANRDWLKSKAQEEGAKATNGRSTILLRWLRSDIHNRTYPETIR